jgi:Flp pilus assembly protein TadG
MSMRKGKQHPLQNRSGLRARSQRGIAMVEFVIAAPVVLFIGLAIAEMGYALMQYNTLTQSLRDGARHLANVAENGNSGEVNLTADDLAAVENLVAYGTIGPGTPVVPGLVPTNITVTDLGDLTLSIQVAYIYQPLLIGGIPKVFANGSGSISTALTMRSEMIVRAL